MANKDPRIDAYIEKSAPFARPILNYLRQTVHEACSEVEETLKWGMPHFDYKGSILCHMASFKQHCAFGFFKAALMADPAGLFGAGTESAMGQFGRIASLTDLPEKDVLIAYILEAKKLNDEGKKLVRKAPAVVKEIIVPAYFTEALNQNQQALISFEKFSPSHRKEYVQWVTEAKTEATRQKRLDTTVEWLAEGKTRNWKSEKK